MAYSILATGTTYYGKTKWQGDSYVTTLWVAVLAMPIWPLSSLRVADAGVESRQNPIYGSTTMSYRVLDELPRDVGQVIRIYLFGWSYLAYLATVLPYVLDHTERGGGFFSKGFLFALATIAAPWLPVLAARALAKRRGRIKVQTGTS